MKTAILVDGGFYRRRAQIKIGEKTSAERANELDNYCRRHLTEKNQPLHELYRIFYYDCPPMGKKVFHPYLKTQIDFSKSDLNIWMTQFLAELKQHRKFALRLGKLADSQACYTLRVDAVKKLCSGKLHIEDLTEKDFMIQVDQKGVDMKIGLDIASLSYKKQVDQIVLLSGDSDFVSAAKLARREGIDFVLDPLGAPIKEDLFEHIDGLRTCDSRYTKIK
ncbi:MAG: NYN domain-containing protein [Hungatella sp.]